MHSVRRGIVIRRLAAVALPLVFVAADTFAQNNSLADLVDRIRPSIVGIGTQQVTRQPPNQLLGTGFVIGDGNYVATNAHVIPHSLNLEQLERVVAFVGRGKRPSIRTLATVKKDLHHDLVILKLSGRPVRPLQIAVSDRVREGQAVALTGFPIGAVLGLYPVTHHGIVSAITPIAIPAPTSQQLNAGQIVALSDPFDVFQLDATAYPGNSGSPVYDIVSGGVIGIVNQVLVKGSKENLLKDPSAITYAIPSKYLAILLRQATRSQ